MAADDISGLGPEEQYYRLKPAYRALYRAARAAARGGGEEGPAQDADENADPVHTQLRQQVAALLEDTELSQAERAHILDSITCPCCGGSGASFSLSIKPMGKGGF